MQGRENNLSMQLNEPTVQSHRYKTDRLPEVPEIGGSLKDHI